MKIIVVDDDDLYCELISHSVAALGHDVLSVDSARRALEEVRNGRSVDLIISDWMMPGMSGVDLCAEIRRQPRQGHVFFLLLTSRESREDYLEAMQAGADDFLIKPFDHEMLAAKIRAAERILDLQTELSESNAQLQQSNRELDEAYRNLQKDIQAAAKLQLGLLPPDEARFGRFLVSATLMPSSAVSGDIYNFFSLENGSFGLYSLDVAGHGPRAAMMSFAISRFIVDQGMAGKLGSAQPLGAHIAELNKTFQSAPPDNDYFTMLLATISDQGRMRISQAGHPHPIAVPDAGRSPYPLGQGGFAVGLLEGVTYDEFSVDLADLHRIVFYTDGVIECGDPSGRLFGIDRFQALLQATSALPLDEVIPTIKAALCEWRGLSEFDDDISIIIVEKVGSEQGAS